MASRPRLGLAGAGRMNSESTYSDRATTKAIFGDACDLAGEARTALLDARCGLDAALRVAVQSLLEAHDRAGTFMEQAAVTAVDAPPEVLPRMVGRYKLLELIGEGG